MFSMALWWDPDSPELTLKTLNVFRSPLSRSANGVIRLDFEGKLLGAELQSMQAEAIVNFLTGRCV